MFIAPMYIVVAVVLFLMILGTAIYLFNGQGYYMNKAVECHQRYLETKVQTESNYNLALKLAEELRQYDDSTDYSYLIHCAPTFD